MAEVSERMAKTKSVKYVGAKGKVSLAKIVGILKAHIGTTFTSTELRDLLGMKSRTQTRRIMRALAKADNNGFNVQISERKLTEKRNVFTFEIM